MESIIEESQKAKKNGIFGIFKNKKIIIPLLLIIIVGGAWYFIRGGEEQNQRQAQARQWTITRDDIQIAIEADGKVVAEDGVELSFSVSGDTLEVEEVFITEGQTVKKGDQIATVKTKTLQLNVNQTYSNYLSALASFNDKVDGATDEDIQKALADIEQAEIALEQSKISLEKTKISAADKIRAAEQALDNAEEDLEMNQDLLTSEDVREAYEDLVDTIKSIGIEMDSILPESDEIIGVDNKSINNSFENSLGAEKAGSLSTAQGSYSIAKAEKEELSTLTIGLSKYSDYADIDAAAIQAEAALNAFEDHLYDMQVMLDASISSNVLPQTSLDSFKSTINANRTSINNKITSLNTDLNVVEDAAENLDNYVSDYEDAKQDLADARAEGEQDIANAEANVRTKEIALENKIIDYNELLAPLTDAEMASARSSLTAATVALQKSQNELDEATLRSPIDGEIALLNYKTGDIILKDDNKPMVQIINNDTLFIEVNIEEADISKVKVGQKAVATFDAVDDLELEGEISFISLTSQTSNNGIVTYLVRVLFENSGESEVREGMTAFVDFVTADVRDVLTVPVDAVRNVGGEPSVQLTSGEWTPVVTGFTDGEMVEVISGLSEGDTITY